MNNHNGACLGLIMVWCYFQHPIYSNIRDLPNPPNEVSTDEEC